MSEFDGLWKHEHNQHALVSPKTECGCPSGGGIQNGHLRYSLLLRNAERKKKKVRTSRTGQVGMHCHPSLLPSLPSLPPSLPPSLLPPSLLPPLLPRYPGALHADCSTLSRSPAEISRTDETGQVGIAILPSLLPPSLPPLLPRHPGASHADCSALSRSPAEISFCLFVCFIA